MNTIQTITLNVLVSNRFIGTLAEVAVWLGLRD